MKPKCECGGTLKQATLRGYDFSADAGLPVTLARVPGWRCTRCGGETLDGQAIGAALRALALAIVRQPERLTADEARYLRKFLDATQRELASRMGIIRETVAAWECGQTELSPQHDYILRTLVVMQVFSELPPKSIADAAGALTSVHTARSKRRKALELEIGDLDAA